MVVNLEKTELRKEVKRRLAALQPKEIAAASERICQKITDMPVFGEAQGVAFFMPLPTEPDLTPLMKLLWGKGAEVSVPGAWGSDSAYVPCVAEEVTDFLKGPVGILQPEAFHPVNPGSIRMMFVPGLAFDLLCGRVGHGCGHYDKMISAVRQANSKCLVIGICFDVQIFEVVPTVRHDMPMDLIMTEKRTIKCFDKKH